MPVWEAPFMLGEPGEQDADPIVSFL